MNDQGFLSRDDVTPIEKQTRPWVCKKNIESCTRTKPCKSCLGRRNRRKGNEAQNQAIKVLEKISGAQPRFRGQRANEETADHLPVRIEVKSGAKTGANAVFGHYFKAERQSDAAKAVGNPKPFVAAFRPDGVNDCLYVVRGSQLEAVLNALGGWA